MIFGMTPDLLGIVWAASLIVVITIFLWLEE